MTVYGHNSAPASCKSPTAPNSTSSPASSVCNIAHHLPRMAIQVPDQKAVVISARRDKSGKAIYESLNFAQMETLSNRYASGLAAHGFTRGQHVLMMVRPGFDFIAITFALFKLGAVPVLIDPGMGIARMLDCIRSVDVQGFIGIPLAQLMRVLRPGSFSKVTHCVTVGRRYGWSGPTLKEIAERGSQHFDLVDTRSDELAAILFTSGSTGPAKGVVYEHGMFDAQVRMIQSHYGILPGEVDLPALPVFALFSTAMGMTCVIPDMDPSRPARVNPALIVEAIVDQHVTNTFGSPAIWKRVVPYCQQHGIKLASLMRVLVAGCAVPPKLIAQLRELLSEAADVHTPYGATEALPICSISGSELFRKQFQDHSPIGEKWHKEEHISQVLPRRLAAIQKKVVEAIIDLRDITGDDFPDHQNLASRGFGVCVGRPLSGIDLRLIRITDDEISQWSDDLLVAPPEYGEVVVAGPVVTKEYYGLPLATTTSKIRDGQKTWHRMGDIGYLDVNGRLWFCGRKSQRVTTEKGTLLADQSELLWSGFDVRSALVGVGPTGKQRAYLILESNAGRPWNFRERRMLREEIEFFLPYTGLDQVIAGVLFHPSLPVDVRHNAKINREALAKWAEKRVGSKRN